MEFLGYLFRGGNEAMSFNIFGIEHMILLAIALIGSLCIMKFKKVNRLLEVSLGVVLLSQQVALYVWYGMTKYNILEQGLPLYHCRVAIIFAFIGLLFNKDIFLKLSAYWGIVTSVIALFIANLDPFSFPHITQLSYFIGHLGLLWASVYILFVKKIGMNKVDLKNMLIFTNVFHITIVCVNNLLQSNYAYTRCIPVNIGFQMSLGLTAISVILVFNIIAMLEYVIINKLWGRRKMSVNVV